MESKYHKIRLMLMNAMGLIRGVGKNVTIMIFKPIIKLLEFFALKYFCQKVCKKASAKKASDKKASDKKPLTKSLCQNASTEMPLPWMDLENIKSPLPLTCKPLKIGENDCKKYTNMLIISFT